MNWFFRWLEKRFRQARNEDNAQLTAEPVRRSRFNDNGMHFTLYKATGGYVIEYTKYDSKTDRNYVDLHVIPDSEDLGQAISSTITLEALRNLR